MTHAHSIAVIGGGWAGIAAAVRATLAGQHVTLFEMARQLGGRARRVDVEGLALDNGQHILIGAYRQTLDLMASIGIDPRAVLARMPLTLCYPDGSGLHLPRGAPMSAFVRGVLTASGWTVNERLRLLLAAASWGLAGFRCDPDRSVAELTQLLPVRVRATLIEPLCVAALNTPAERASAAVFLRVLRDALFSGRGSADLLLPRRSLGSVLPEPAERWLVASGAFVSCGSRVARLTAMPHQAGWQVNGQPFAGVVLACSSYEAARLTQAIAPAWAAQAAAFEYEPIVTVYLRSAGTRLAQPMTALICGPDAPSQFVFDLGSIGGAVGVFAFVVSGAREWVARGLDATTDAVLRQAVQAFAAGTWREPPRPLRTLAERRATFACTPGLLRPPASIAPRLMAAGDYVQGPYPATLEGAVRAGNAAAEALSV